MIEIAKKYKIQVTWVFGEAGHGRGLVDGMAWFGCKGPLRVAIICHGETIWFPTALSMVEFLEMKFSNDETKVYRHIDQEQTASIRRLPRSERKVVGCRAAHVIIAKADGSITVKACIDDNILDLTSETVQPPNDNDDSDQDSFIQSEAD